MQTSQLRLVETGVAPVERRAPTRAPGRPAVPDEVLRAGEHTLGRRDIVALVTRDEGPTELFAKLYAMSHVRSDRWYKLGRTILYGRLEDEHRFSSVRRIVQHEDYVLHVETMYSTSLG